MPLSLYSKRSAASLPWERFLLLAICCVACGIWLAPHSLAALPDVVEGKPLPSLAPMLERTTPAVVNISTRAHVALSEHPLLRDPILRWFFDLQEPDRKPESSSLGSGVVVDAAAGLVLTNHHVIDKAGEILVTLHDGRRVQAKLVGSDPETDIAVLRISAPGVTALPLGDSDRLRVGDFVVAIGSPFGLSQTVTSGIVSALGRSDLGIEGYESFIQTDASINPGNSGGPLVNLRGELVGLNTAILAPGGGNVGIGFAIPVNMARAIMTQLVMHGEVRRGLLGVQTQDLTPALMQALGVKDRQGALVVRVDAGSPAQKAGLVEGDLVLMLDGKPIRNSADLRNKVGLVRAGETVSLEIVRAGEPRQLRVELTDLLLSYVEGEHFHAYLDGALLGEVRDESAYGRFDAIQVGRVEQDSNAWHFGLREGDVILEANRQRTTGFRDLATQARRSRHALMVKIRRSDKILVLVSQ